ncbi:hypothetical protein VB602_14995 [Vibrio parahaemolyticus]|uniref:hypothetical protein n=1 Tax=Vibrio parahaemolyticus TaxID=670 RepID=UPI002B1EB9BE|nr:hypothetical protein [Vibrio parahaemolyticus]MEA5237617.1 hypothetical protein [Vibrio parahaemolyticus]
MKSEDFSKCREFLERCIIEQPDNTGYLEAYVKLLELKSEYDKETDKARIEKEIREAELNTQFNTTVNNNNTDYNKAVYQNNTDFNIAANTNFAQTQQHQQAQQLGVVSTAINNGWKPDSW